MDLTLRPTVGLAEGYVFQFAEGAWAEPGDGVAMSEAAFDLVVPYLERMVARWGAMARYGVTELEPIVAETLAAALMERASTPDPQADFLIELGQWIAARATRGRSISILGV